MIGSKGLKLVVSCSFSFKWEKSHSFSPLQCNYLSQKSVKTLRFCSKCSNFLQQPWHCLQVQAETAWMLKSSFISVMLLKLCCLLTLYQKLFTIFPYILKQSLYLYLDPKLQIYLKNGKWIHFIGVVYLNKTLITFTLTRATLQINLSGDIILNKLEWHHWTRLVPGLRRRSLAFVSSWTGGYGYT